MHSIRSRGVEHDENVLGSRPVSGLELLLEVECCVGGLLDQLGLQGKVQAIPAQLAMGGCGECLPSRRHLSG